MIKVSTCLGLYIHYKHNIIPVKSIRAMTIDRSAGEVVLMFDVGGDERVLLLPDEEARQLLDALDMGDVELPGALK